MSIEKKLFTPGPLCVSQSVKTAMNVDMGSRDPAFINIIQNLRRKLVEIAGLSVLTHTAILMQGSGTFAVESVLQSTSQHERQKKVLILACGAYGKRMHLICEKAGISNKMLLFPEDQPITLDENAVQDLKSGEYGSVAVVHCETTSGLLNPIFEIGQKIKQIDPHLVYIVDGMSSFGGIVYNYDNVDFLISSANKCLQGVPGFAFVICNKGKLQGCRGRSKSLSLDLFDQWAGLETNGQFRFTPPTHCILALTQAIRELEQEGGVAGRAKRYKENNKLIKNGMGKLGFERFVADEADGYIITSFRYPNHPNFHFEDFYDRLSNKGHLIYPGKVTNADCFRVGNIGHLFPNDMTHLLDCITEVLQDMEISIPLK